MLLVELNIKDSNQDQRTLRLIEMACIQHGYPMGGMSLYAPLANSTSIVRLEQASGLVFGRKE